MKKIFTTDEQQQAFALGKQHFLQGHYAEAEPLLQLVIESALQHNDHHTYFDAMIWLNRIFINTRQIRKMYPILLKLEPLVGKFGGEDENYFYPLHKAIFNYHYLIGDPLKDYELLFHNTLSSNNHYVILLVGSNLLFTYLEYEEIDKGIALFQKLQPLYDTHGSTNKMTALMHYVYGFLLFYAKRDYSMCAKLLSHMEQGNASTTIETTSYNYDICKALFAIQQQQTKQALTYFEQALKKVSKLIYLRYALKLWIQALKEHNLKNEVIFYQQLFIQMLDEHYNEEMSAMRAQSITELTRQSYEEQLYIDQLTGVKNRNYYEELLRKEQQMKNYTIAVLDIDFFKAINDAHGHSIGDKAIQFVAQHLTKWKPHHDISIIRYGGDEFIILMPYPLANVQATLQALHEKILATPLHSEHATIPLSISIGVSYTNSSYRTLQQLFHYADAAIYNAKQTRGVIAYLPCLN